MSDEATPQLKPVTPERIGRELSELNAERKSGAIDATVYDQKFARMIHELRERRISGGRAEVMAALEPLLKSGAIAADQVERLTRQLGMA